MLLNAQDTTLDSERRCALALQQLEQQASTGVDHAFTIAQLQSEMASVLTVSTETAVKLQQAQVRVQSPTHVDSV